MIRISKAAARFTTSRPMLPRPTMPSVLPRSSVPMNLRFSHLPDFGGSAGRGNRPRQGQHQREGVLGHRDGVAARRVHHQHAGGGGGGQIDVVDADARAPDHAQLGRRARAPCRPPSRRCGRSARRRRQVLRVLLGIGNDDFPARLLLEAAFTARAASGSAIRILMVFGS